MFAGYIGAGKLARIEPLNTQNSTLPFKLEFKFFYKSQTFMRAHWVCDQNNATLVIYL